MELGGVLFHRAVAVILHALAYAIKIKGMILDHKAYFRRCFMLPLFNLGFDKLEDLAALNTGPYGRDGRHHSVQTQQGPLELMPNYEARRFELGQHSVYGREADLFAGFQ